MTWGDILIYLAGILWGVELIPQIQKTMQTKDVRGISLAFYVICYGAYIISSVGNAINKNWPMIISYIPSFILLAVMIFLILKYRGVK
jgi:uncharacterized protein with PQ loop repeat